MASTDAPIYEIVDWSEHFENSRSRTMQNARWCPIPNRFDGERMADLIAEGGDGVYAAWCACLLIASRCDPRGRLVKASGKAHTPSSLSRITGITAESFKTMLRIAEEVGLITRMTGKCQAPVTQVSPKGMEGKEENEGMEPADQPRADALKAFERLMGKQLSIHAIGQFDQWSQTVPESVTLDGQAFKRYALIVASVSAAISAMDTPPRGMNNATAYLTRVIDRCINEDCKPGEFKPRETKPRRKPEPGASPEDRKVGTW
jgi:hypothetical protein